MSYTNLCGWTKDPEAVERVIEDPGVPIYRMRGDQLEVLQAGQESDKDRRPVILFDALQALHPTWRRGSQAIGDCVSWGWELGTTISVAVDIFAKFRPFVWPGEFATEPYYGGARVEARGIQRGGWSDGAIGAYAAKWGIKWGALARQDWSKKTGNPDHNLERYNGERSKAWGNWGNGGRDDKGILDAVAKEYALTEAPMVTSFEAAKASIENGFPVPVCSDQGFTDERDSQGFVRPSGTWMHCMLFCGVRYDRPGLLCANSWGFSWKGKFYPLNYWPEVQKCSAWVDASVCDRMLRQQDSYAVCGVTGLQRRVIDWTKGWEIN